MPSLAFVMPVYGRLPLAQICLRQLRRTCDALTENGLHASAVVVGDDGNLDVAANLGFATVRRDNQFVSRKFNDGIQVACEHRIGADTELLGHGEYEVTGRREYRGHPHGTVFQAFIGAGPENRAVARGDIQLLRRVRPCVDPGSYTYPEGWGGPADYVIPIGSDDWIDWRIITDVLPEPDEVVGYQHISFVREDGCEITKTFLNYTGGCGMRIYPRQLLEHVGLRPAEEDLPRGCDTSILTNVRTMVPELKVMHVETDPRQIVDWKSSGGQLNEYEQVMRRHGRHTTTADDPFADLAGFFPAEALNEMAAYYERVPIAA